MSRSSPHPLERHFEHLGIRAAAGTGKTYRLTNRYLGLLLADQPAQSILATTFTRKAAGEIMDRVLGRLAEAALDAEKCKSLADDIGAPDLTPDEARRRLVGLVRELHRLNICTLDSFYGSIATSFSLELGLPPNWRIVEESVDQQLRAQAIRAALEGADREPLDTLLRMVHKDQAARPIAQRIAMLVNELYALYLQAPREAWYSLPHPATLDQNMLDDAIEIMGEVELPMTAQGKPNGHWLKAHRKAIEAVRTKDWADLISRGIAPKIISGESEFQSQPITDEIRRAYHPLIVNARAVFMNRLADQTEATHKLLARFDVEYQRLKRARGAFRFDDVTRVLAEGGAIEDLKRLYYRLDARLNHVLLDEFQDTSPTQWKVLQPIAEEVTGHADAPRSLFCVGDVKQAIYAWRGGEAGIFDTLGAQLPSVAWQSMNTSYRSAQPIIDVTNAVFESLDANPALENYTEAAEDWSNGFQTHTTERDELAGYAAVEVAPRADDGGNQLVSSLRYTARRIKEIARQAPGKSIGVLLRQNSKGQIARLIYELASDKDGGPLAASEEGGNPLTDSPAVNLVLSLLTLADHPGHSAALFHVAHSPLGPLVGLKPELVSVKIGRDHPTPPRVIRVAAQIRAELLDKGYAEAIEPWRRALEPHSNRHDSVRLAQLVELAHRYDADATLRPADFVRFVKTQRVEDPDAQRVRVMTIHRSKGLQFDVVVLPNLDVKLVSSRDQVVVEKDPETLSPRSICAYAKKEIVATLREEDRAMFESRHAGQVRESLSILYVAITRAVHALHIVADPSSEGEQRLPASYLGVLRGALTDRNPLAGDEGTVYSCGDVEWYLREDEGDGTEKDDEVGSGEGAEPMRRPALIQTKRRSRCLARLSPSGAEGDNKVDLNKRLTLGSNVVLAFGSAVHLMFERVGWLDEGEPEPASLRALLEEHMPGQVDVDKLVTRFNKMISQPETRNALMRSAYPADRDVQLLTEQSFAVRLDDAVLSGALDRLVITREAGRPVAAHILDYKTDRIEDEPGALDARVEHYRPQIDHYRYAVEKLYGVSPEEIRATLLFVTAGATRDVR
ncbi:MAG: UvrD-helicase domain-containing protein [Planctomycetota bacterium]|jgi:ATP-dependent exoDNAse (exonuclease V) beta subunit